MLPDLSSGPAELILSSSFKKSPKGYERPVEDYTNDQYHEGTNGQSGLYPQMQEQAGYHANDGLGYSQQYQGNTGSQSLQYSDYVAEPQSQNAQGLYSDSQGPPQYWQQNVAAGAAAAALPPGAAAAIVVGSNRSGSSSASPTSYASTAPLRGQSHHHQQNSQSSFLVPYRGYAEPVDDGRI